MARYVFLFAISCMLILATFFSAHADPAVDKAIEEAHLKKSMMVADKLGLNEKQQKIFWPLYNNYQRDLQKLAKKRVTLAQDVKASSDSSSNSDATALIRRALTLEEERLALKKRNVGLFLEKLPPTVVARYFQLENKIQIEVDSKIADQVPLIGGTE